MLFQLFAGLVRRTEAGTAPFDGPGAVVHDLVTRAGTDHEARRLAFATAWVLQSLAETAPLVLVVDDLQWADQLSLQVVATVPTLAADEAVLLVVGVRNDPSMPPADDVAALVARAGTHRVLSPLRHADLADWLRERTGAAARDTVSRLQVASAGVPYYVQDLLEATDEPGDESAQALLVQRVEALGEAERAVLRAVALLGEEAVDEHVVGLTGLAPERLLEAYAALRGQRLLAPQSLDLPLRSPTRWSSAPCSAPDRCPTSDGGPPTCSRRTVVRPPSSPPTSRRPSPARTPSWPRRCSRPPARPSRSARPTWRAPS